MPKRVKAVLFLACSAVVLAAIVFLRSKSPAGVGVEGAQGPRPDLSITTLQNRAALREPRLSDRRDPVSPEEVLARQYETSTDRRAFYDMALRQPENGGVYFAIKVATECMAWVSNGKNNAQWLAERVAAIPSANPQREKIVAALRRTHESCFGFDSAPVPFSAFRAHAAIASQDPIRVSIAELRAALSSDTGAPALPGMLEQAARSGNPYRIYESLLTLGSANSEQMAVTVDGNVLHPVFWNAFALALPAAACISGVDCSASAPGLTIQCTRGRCYDDVYQYARAALDDAQYQQFLRFHDITVAALINKDFSRFGVLRKTK